jgi:molybdate transport system substrate-binding protein
MKLTSNNVLRGFVAAAGVLIASSGVEAAELKLISSVGVRPALEEILQRYERASGNVVAVQFGTAAQMKKKIDAGEPFDVAILGSSQIDELIKEAKADPASRSDVARAGIGFAVREQAATPDVGSDEKLRAYLERVSSIASGNPATGGFGAVFFDNLVQRLGIAQVTRPKTKFSPPGEFARQVASGEAELGVGLVSEIVSVRGVKSVPLMPHDPASYLHFAGAVAASSRNAAAARALLEYLTSPASQDVFEAKGMGKRDRQGP